MSLEHLTGDAALAAEEQFEEGRQTSTQNVINVLKDKGPMTSTAIAKLIPGVDVKTVQNTVSDLKKTGNV